MEFAINLPFDCPVSFDNSTNFLSNGTYDIRTYLLISDENGNYLDVLGNGKNTTDFTSVINDSDYYDVHSVTRCPEQRRHLSSR